MAMSPAELDQLRKDLISVRDQFLGVRNNFNSKAQYDSAIKKFEDLRMKLEGTYYEKNNQYLNKDTVLDYAGRNSKVKKWEKSSSEFAHAAMQMVGIIDQEIFPYASQIEAANQQRQQEEQRRAQAAEDAAEKARIDAQVASQLKASQDAARAEQQKTQNLQTDRDNVMSQALKDFQNFQNANSNLQGRSETVNQDTNTNSENLSGMGSLFSAIDPTLAPLGYAIENQGNRLFGADFQSTNSFYGQETLNALKGMALQAVADANPELANEITSQIGRNKAFTQQIDTAAKQLLDKGLDYKTASSGLQSLLSKSVKLDGKSENLTADFQKELDKLGDMSTKELSNLTGVSEQNLIQAQNDANALRARSDQLTGAMGGQSGDLYNQFSTQLANLGNQARDVTGGLTSDSQALANRLNQQNQGYDALRRNLNDVNRLSNDQFWTTQNQLQGIRDANNSAEFNLSRMAGQSADLTNQMVYGSRFGATPLEQQLSQFQGQGKNLNSRLESLVGRGEQMASNTNQGLSQLERDLYSLTNTQGFNDLQNRADALSGIGAQMSGQAQMDRGALLGLANQSGTSARDLAAIRSYGYDAGNEIAAQQVRMAQQEAERQGLIQGANNYAQNILSAQNPFIQEAQAARNYNNNLRYDSNIQFNDMASRAAQSGRDAAWRAANQDQMLAQLQNEVEPRYNAIENDLRTLRGMNDQGFLGQRNAAYSIGQSGYNEMQGAKTNLESTLGRSNQLLGDLSSQASQFGQTGINTFQGLSQNALSNENTILGQMSDVRGRYDAMSRESDPRFQAYKQAQTEELDFQKQEQIRQIRDQFASLGKAGSSQELNAIQRVNDQYSRQSRQLTSELGLQEMSRQDQALGTLSSLTGQEASFRNQSLGQRAGLEQQGLGYGSQALDRQSSFANQMIGNEQAIRSQQGAFGAQSIDYLNQANQQQSGLLQNQLANAQNIQNQISGAVGADIGTRSQLAGQRLGAAGQIASSENAAIGQEAGLRSQNLTQQDRLTAQNLNYTGAATDAQTTALTQGFDARNQVGFNALNQLGNQISQNVDLSNAKQNAFTNPIQLQESLRSQGNAERVSLIGQASAIGQSGYGNQANILQSQLGLQGSFINQGNQTAADLINNRANLQQSQLGNYLQGLDRTENTLQNVLGNTQNLFNQAFTGQQNINNVYEQSMSNDIARRQALAAQQNQQLYNELGASQNQYSTMIGNQQNLASQQANLLSQQLSNAQSIGQNDLAFRQAMQQDFLNRQASIYDSQYNAGQQNLNFQTNLGQQNLDRQLMYNQYAQDARTQDLMNQMNISNMGYDRNQNLANMGYQAGIQNINTLANQYNQRAGMYMDQAAQNRQYALDTRQSAIQDMDFINNYLASSGGRAVDLQTALSQAPLDLIGRAGANLDIFSQSANQAKQMELDALMAGLNMLTVAPELKFAKNAVG